MELSPDQQAEVTSVLSKHPIGIKYKALWDKCKTFDSEHELSQCLHRMTQLGLMFKKFDLYFKEGIIPPAVAPEPEPTRRNRSKPTIVKYNEDTDAEADDEDEVDEDADSEEDLELAKSEKVDRPVKREIVRPVGLEAKPPLAVVPKKEGSTQRTKSAGGALLALYKCRNDRPLSLSDLEFFTGASRTTLYAAMQRALAAGYVAPDSTGRFALFKWTDQYKYPFDKWKTTDERLLANSYKDWQVKEGIGSKVGMPAMDEDDEDETVEVDHDKEVLSTYGVEVQSCSKGQCGNGSISATLAHIDSQIRIHEAKLETLRSIKVFMTKGSQATESLEANQH